MTQSKNQEFKENPENPCDRRSSLSNEILDIYDEFSDVCDVQAYLNHANILIINEPELITHAIASGARISTDRLSRRMIHLRDELRKYQERCVAEQPHE